MDMTEKRKKGRAESHGIFKMQCLHMDVGLGRESEASAMNARAQGWLSQQGYVIGLKMNES